MSEMPARMTIEWVKEEILDAISDRYCDLVRGGLTLAEENAWRRQQGRVAKFLGFPLEQVAPASAIEAQRAETPQSGSVEDESAVPQADAKKGVS